MARSAELRPSFFVGPTCWRFDEDDGSSCTGGELECRHRRLLGGVLIGEERPSTGHKA
ncbi:hypothetical protein JCM18909_2880 [Cutibacterium acnes JCM 18909]|nr:hypothetical protein JCM18909_2880 [Cutibacterium acnes JCM 18909]